MNQFHATDFFLYPLEHQKTSGLLMFSSSIRLEIAGFQKKIVTVSKCSDL